MKFEVAAISGVILAGGKSSRMGTDKGLVDYMEKPMITYGINLLQPICNDVMIISNQEGYEKFGFPVYKDRVESVGPLSGIYTALLKSKHKVSIILSCDTPNVNRAILLCLLRHIDSYDCCVARYNDRVHPLCGVYKKSTRSIFLEDIKNGHYKLTETVGKLNCKEVDLSNFPEKIFKNINYSKDLIS